MPDASGQLTQEDKKKVTTWLEGNGFNVRSECPLCGDRHWAIADHLVVPIPLGPNNSVMLGGPSYAHVMLISVKCGYTMFINATIAGISPRAASPVPPATP